MKIGSGMQKFIEHVLERSLTLDERLGLGVDPNDEQIDIILARDRLDAWIKARGLPEDEFFEEVNIVYGNPEELKGRLGSDRTSILPSFIWFEQCYSLVERLLSMPTTYHDSDFTPELHRPFQAVFNDIIKFAEERLFSEIRGDDKIYAIEGLYRCLKNHLWIELSDLLSLAVYQQAVAGGYVATSSNEGEDDTNIYKYMKEKGWALLLEQSPAIVRIINALVSQWVNFSKHLIIRFTDDYRIIQKHLNLPNDQGLKIRSIKCGLSDPHCCGQTVAKIEFSNMACLFYKPRSVKNDLAWASLLKWVAGNGFQVPLVVPSVIDRGEYGWVEAIFSSECHSRCQVKRYFRTAGAWTAFLHILNSNDFHEENVISAGDQFVPLDFEATLSAAEKRAKYDNPSMAAVNKAEKLFENSVVSTGILPTNRARPGGGFESVGALTNGDLVSTFRVDWKVFGSGLPSPEIVRTELPKETALPTLDGEAQRLYDYREQYLEGLAYALNFIELFKEPLLKNEGLVSHFSRISVRRIIRPTAFYALLLNRLRDPRSWIDGASWSAQIRFLDRLPPTSSSVRLEQFFRASEIRSLSNLDVPWFVHNVKAERISDGNHEVNVDGDIVSGIEVVKKRLESLTSVEIQRQVKTAELSILVAHLESGNEIASNKNIPLLESGTIVGQHHTRQLFESEVHRVRSLIVDCALVEHQSASWVGITSQAGHSGGSVGHIGHSLYSGQSGVAIFLAAYSAVFGCRETENLAIKALEPVKFLLSSVDSDHFIRATGSHGLAGIAGVVYSLSLVGDLLGDCQLGKYALAAAKKHLCLPAINAGHDLMSGAAGSVLALCRLYATSRDEEVLSQIMSLGEKYLWSPSFLASVESSNLGQKPVLSGLSHGLAGISLAVSSANRFVNDPALRLSTEALLKLESERFLIEDKNWPDLRVTDVNGERASPCQWCHGAVGIGFSRIPALNVLGRSQVALVDVERAVEAVLSRQMRPVDHLCCGNFGQIEFLTDAARLLKREDIEAAALKRAVVVISSARNADMFGWPVGNDSDNVGFFNGLSGVGYSLLRNLSDGNLPSVATMQ